MVNVDKIQLAWKIASEYHGKQRYGKQPYLLHLVNVFTEINNLSYFVDKEDCLITSILHDVLEDTKIPLEVIQTNFGANVLSAVISLTKNDKQRKELQMIESLMAIKRRPNWVSLVKLADRISNLSHPNKWDVYKRDLYLRESELILKELGVASPYFASRLQIKIDEYEKQTKELSK